ncbi:hypothetical protein ZIOFF_063947 [Zingiber officinale]|uniref:Hcy-binding domain-containing protein n=1 Tax=Zingiber officinale TaxID=94328 RepID=A0A8J5KHX2_ZINOF|nr:hypothetical protein ZIOFF_063947 [Zingiber officinale]
MDREQQINNLEMQQSALLGAPPPRRPYLPKRARLRQKRSNPMLRLALRIITCAFLLTTLTPPPSILSGRAKRQVVAFRNSATLTSVVYFNLEGYGKNRAPLLLLLVAASIGSYGFSEGAVNLKQRPVLVAASIGSYGAYLADGSEYSGNYGQEITVEIVKDFHRRRLEVLSEAGANIIAFETIPNKLEAQVSFDVFVELSNGSCSSFVAHLGTWGTQYQRDGINVVSGDSMAECVSLADSCNKVVAIGINCAAPRFIHNLILSIKKVAPLVVSDAAMLAPEEIFHGKGNIKEEAELTKEERKRRRANQKRRFRRLKDRSMNQVKCKSVDDYANSQVEIVNKKTIVPKPYLKSNSASVFSNLSCRRFNHSW